MVASDYTCYDNQSKIKQLIFQLKNQVETKPSLYLCLHLLNILETNEFRCNKTIQSISMFNLTSTHNTICKELG